jgi:hypothetical protein
LADCKSVDFVLFEIKADNYYKVTARKWELEMFRQLDEMINRLVAEGRLDNDMQNSQPNLSQTQEETLGAIYKDRKRALDSTSLSGKYYRFTVNVDRNECRPATDKNGKCLLLEFLQVLDNLCKKETNFQSFVKKMQDSSLAENDADEEGYMDDYLLL